MPQVASGYVRYGAGGPLALHDAGWSLRAVRAHLPDGAVVRIRAGAGDPPPPGPAREVWLFGDVAESSDRFPDAAVTVVEPPAFYGPGANVVRVVREGVPSCR